MENSSYKNNAKRLSRVSIRSRWITKRNGGIFLGIKINFPICVMYCEDETYQTVFISLGFLFFTIDIGILGERIYDY
jgi:hypothetical protein